MRFVKRRRENNIGEQVLSERGGAFSETRGGRAGAFGARRMFENGFYGNFLQDAAGRKRFYGQASFRTLSAHEREIKALKKHKAPFPRGFARKKELIAFAYLA